MDGSCFLKLDLNVSLGFLQLPGHPDGWQAVVPSLMGSPGGSKKKTDERSRNVLFFFKDGPEMGGNAEIG